MKYFIILVFTFLVSGCKDEAKVKVLSADEIVNRSIEVSGGEKFERSAIDFVFRDKEYFATREKLKFSLVRMFNEDSSTAVIDELNNNGFIRKTGNNQLNDFKIMKVADSLVKLYSASVNSVHYFSVLPYGLNDKAVNKTLLGEEQIKAKTYYKIKVTFEEDGGGEDYEDVFIYWFDKETFKVHYLAYSYNEDDGVGMRFRAAYNERYVNGLRFVDYNNYKPENDTVKLEDLGKAFEANQLKLLSKIDLENVSVDLIDL